ncbi:hypothetical protein AAF712_012172 [Marasmius tenuissimus]|uniref:BTB domain-containing protein n=1 Tax=Marasmius tenuissimus TaxID=585030 RepID=A0ABR2ZJ88_9AGAR
MFTPSRAQLEDESTVEMGTSPEKPIVLHEVTKADFGRFLSVLYPRYSKYWNISIDSETWLAAYKLARLWNFTEIQEGAIERVSLHGSLRASDRIVAGREHRVLRWFLEGVMEMGVPYNTRIFDNQVQEVGLETAVNLCHLQAALRSHDSAFGGFGSRGREEEVLHMLGPLVSSLFDRDICDMGASETVVEERGKRKGTRRYKHTSMRVSVGDRQSLVCEWWSDGHKVRFVK